MFFGACFSLACFVPHRETCRRDGIAKREFKLSRARLRVRGNICHARVTWERTVIYSPINPTSAQVGFPRTFLAPPRLPHGIRNLDQAKNANIRVRTPIENITKTSAVYHVTGWADTVVYGGIVASLNLAPGNVEFLTGEYTRTSSSPASVRINFERPFSTPPKVLSFFNAFDLDRSKNWRLKTGIANIDKNGFTLDIETWADTILYSTQVGWIAYPEDRERIFSASVSTQEVRPPSQPRLQTAKSITFGNVEFRKYPNVFVAFNEIDIDCKANFRLNAYVDNVNRDGLTWHLDSWADSVVYSAGAAIIAVE